MAPISISTPIPSGMSKAEVIAALHNHDNYIRTTCPQLVSYELESGDDSSTAIYTVTDKKPMGNTTYKLSLTNTPEGIDALVDGKMPMGAMKINSKWHVTDQELIEVVDVEANMVTRKLIRGNVEKSHPDQQKALLAGIRQI